MPNRFFVAILLALGLSVALDAQSQFGNQKVQAGATCPPVTAPLSGAGTLYTCTGTGALYTWTGSAWVAVAGGGGGTPSAPSFSVQYNNAGSFGGSSLFTFDPSDQAAETPNLQLFNDSSGTQGYLMEVDSTSTAAGSTANYPRMFHSVFNMNGTGTVTGKRVMPASLEVFNNTTGTITWSSSAEVYAENIDNGNWTTMLGIGSRLFNDGSGTVGRMVAFATSETDHFQNGNYGGGAVTYYAAFEGNGVNANGTYGDVYGLRLLDQSGLTVSGNNHAINYNDTFVVHSDGSLYNGINSTKIDDIDSSAYVAPALAGTGAGNVSNGTHRYKFTVENSGATIHTAGGTPTSAVTVTNNAVNGKVVVSVPVLCFSPTEFSAAVRVYRDKNSDGVYKLVGDATSCQRDYVDNIADGSLGATVPTTNNTEFNILTVSNASIAAPVNAFYSHTLELSNPPNAAATSEFLYYYIFPKDRDTATTPHMGIALFGNQNDVPLGAGMYNTEGGHVVLQGGAESTGGQAYICGGAAFPGTVGSGSYTDALEGGCVTAYGSTATDAGRIEIVSGVAFAGAAANLNGGNVTIRSGAPANSGHYGDLTMDLWRNITMTGSGPVVITGGTASKIQTDTTTGHTFLLNAYDVDGAAYSTFATLTNGNTPTMALASPSGGTLTIASWTGPSVLTEVVGSSGLTLTGATQTSSFPVLNMTQTWNNSGTTFTAVKLNVTNTNSASASLLADFQVGGSPQAQITKGGSVIGGIATGGSASAVAVGAAGANRGLWSSGGSQTDVAAGGVTTMTWSNNSVLVPADVPLGFGPNNASGSSVGATVSAAFYRDAAQTIAQRNSTNAQAFRLYNTFSSSTSYERLDIDWITTANVILIGAQKGSGGGTARVMSLVYGGTSTAAISIPITSGDITFGGVLAPTGYKSSDGSAGITGSTCSAWKNGLCTSS